MNAESIAKMLEENGVTAEDLMMKLKTGSKKQTLPPIGEETSPVPKEVDMDSSNRCMAVTA